MEQFVFLNIHVICCTEVFFPLHSSPLRIAGRVSTGEPKNTPLTGGLHKKPTGDKMMHWASRSYRESAKLLFFPVHKSHWQNLSSFQPDRTSPLHVQQQSQHQPVQGATRHKHHWFRGTFLEVNFWWQPTT